MVKIAVHLILSDISDKNDNSRELYEHMETLNKIQHSMVVR